jgi:hypothetical protein
MNRTIPSRIRAAAVALCGAFYLSGCAMLGIEEPPPEERAFLEGIDHEYAYTRDAGGRAHNAMACGSAKTTRCNWVWSRPSAAVAEREARAACEREVGGQCRIFAVNDIRSSWARGQAIRLARR